MNAQTRLYLVGRITLLLQDIDQYYREIEIINKLLRDEHKSVSFGNDSPVEPTRRVEPLRVPERSTVRPPLTTTKSAGNLRDKRAATPSDLHPAHRSAVASQSRFPLFSRSEL